MDIKKIFKFEDIKKYSADTKKVDWLIEDWIEKNTIVFMYGKSNQYKSYVALSFAYHLAIGLDINKYKVQNEPCRVIFIATEGLNTLANRYKALELEHGEVPDSSLYLYTGQAFSWEDQFIDELIKQLRFNCDFLIIDSLSASLTNETLNSDAVVRNVISQIKRIRDEANTTVMVVAHTGKNVSKGMMGSAVLRNDVDTEIRVDGTRKIISLTKQRNGSKDDMYIKFMPLPIRLEHDSNLFLDFGTKNVELDDLARKMLQAFKDLNQEVVLKADWKKAWLNIVEPSGIISEKETNNYKSKFNTRYKNFVRSNTFYVKQEGRDYWISERPFKDEV